MYIICMNKWLDNKRIEYVKSILLLCLTILIFWTGKTLAMILIYASPDGIPHVLHASIYILGSSIFIFALYFNLDKSLHIVFKWLFSLVGINSIIDSSLFTYISIYAHPIENSIDIGGAIIFTISTLLYSAGLFYMLKRNRQKILNA